MAKASHASACMWHFFIALETDIGDADIQSSRAIGPFCRRPDAVFHSVHPRDSAYRAAQVKRYQSRHV
jgi:hypothetical protein